MLNVWTATGFMLEVFSWAQGTAVYRMSGLIKINGAKSEWDFPKTNTHNKSYVIGVGYCGCRSKHL